MGDKLVFAITVTNTGTATVSVCPVRPVHDPLISATPMPCGSGPLLQPPAPPATCRT
ncbi:hypothetical protein [Arsenicicoccus dermatophilus]|uniref:hypothetical protein n=1 Tax=Arsenicicoccus dermatophilus TaxID=1076331 RepID=UPI001F4CA791|nr:hypothetical protein [Arsenicicoccus dermatophilus]MCH8614468.1 hypothetical protein [Arsenicicoccus dermatophilus]